MGSDQQNMDFINSLRQECLDELSCMNKVNNVTCQSTDNVNKLERALFIYLYPFIATLCVVGNTANLIVYNHAYLRTSTTIRMLAMKAMANILNILSLLPMHISSLALLSPSSHEIPPPFYWLSLRYVLFFSNVFSTIAIWLTAAVSIENCLLVVFPVHAKFWCTMRNAWASMLVCALAALILHAFNLFCREVFPIYCYDTYTGNISEPYGFQIMDNFAPLESVYYWCNGISTIVVPMIIMLTATLLINYHLVWARSEISRGAEQKRCVVRLSFVTILCHVVFEMPHLAVLAIAARSGSAQDAHEDYDGYQDGGGGNWAALIQILSTFSNFLAQINASIPFVVYFLCSKRFRQLCMITIGGRSALDSFSTTAAGGGGTSTGAAGFSRASASYRRSEVVLLNNNNSRLSNVGHLPLSTFNEDTSPGEATTTTTTNASHLHPAPTSHHVDHSEQEDGHNEPNHQPHHHARPSINQQHTDQHQLITCSESTNLLERND